MLLTLKKFFATATFSIKHLKEISRVENVEIWDVDQYE